MRSSLAIKSEGMTRVVETAAVNASASCTHIAALNQLRQYRYVANRIPGNPIVGTSQHAIIENSCHVQAVFESTFDAFAKIAATSSVVWRKILIAGSVGLIVSTIVQLLDVNAFGAAAAFQVNILSNNGRHRQATT